jgi:hypothetical protein
MVVEAGERVKEGRLGRKIIFLTSSHWRVMETQHMGYLFAVVDSSCVMHACCKRADRARSMPVNWNISKYFLQIQRVQVSADDIIDISG